MAFTPRCAARALRLLAGNVLALLRRTKPQWAAEKLAEMAALPEAQQGDRPAFVAALRFVVSALSGDRNTMLAAMEEAARVLESHLAAELLLFAAAAAARHSEIIELAPMERLAADRRAELPAGMARVVELVADLSAMSLNLPESYIVETSRQIGRNGASIDSGRLAILAQAVAVAGQLEFAYAASGKGLERGGATEANVRKGIARLGAVLHACLRK